MYIDKIKYNTIPTYIFQQPPPQATAQATAAATAAAAAHLQIYILNKYRYQNTRPNENNETSGDSILAGSI